MQASDRRSASRSRFSLKAMNHRIKKCLEGTTLITLGIVDAQGLDDDY